ncbi:ribulose-phosphate 3-epimerase [Patescibacteria group bacterium]|nr:ribulose-phosphate 3-epimerase [Patescibacteria group bacterium]
MKQVIPAILTDDFEDLKNKLKKIKNLADWVQIDIMDGRFVNNHSISLEDLKQAQTKSNLEAHLMVLSPEKYLSQAKMAKVKRVIFHFEATKNILAILKKIAELGLKKGLALNPETEIKEIKPYLDTIDLVLLLAVQPGFGGQKFNVSVISKIKILKELAPEIKIEVDGGINLANIEEVAQAGADYLVVGTGLFKATDIKKRFKQLEQEIK